jgi:zinc transport system ATP-binding protein
MLSGCLLEVRELVAGYAEPVIGPLSFQVHAGEVIGISGPNGSGKSTLLKALGNGVRVFSGAVERRPDLYVGWVEQQPQRLPEMPFSGWEFLRFCNADQPAPPPYLSQCLNQRVDSLSGGQYQLLSVWAVLGGPAELLLLDEPTNNLDRQGEQVVEETLNADQGQRAVLVVSHELRFLERISDRVLEIAP